MNDQSFAPGAPVVPRPLKQLVIGVGGAGGNIAAYLQRVGVGEATVLAANTDAQALAKVDVTDRILLGDALTRGLGAGGDPDRGRQAAEHSLEVLREQLAGADLIYLVAGMGGGTGTGAAPVVARLGRELGALVLSVVTLPFDFEGGRRRELAQQGVQDLRRESDGVIVVPNQKILALAPDNTSMPECFDLIHDYLLQGVRGIVRLIAEPGMINVDFSDLGAVLRGSNGASALAFVEARANDHTDGLMERLQQHPLLDEGQVLTEARSLLVSLNCGPEVSMQEVNRVMAALQAKAPTALINLGVAVNEALAGRITLTIVVGLDGQPLEPLEPPPLESPARGRRKARRPDQPEGEQDTEFLTHSNQAEPSPARFKPEPPVLSPQQMADMMRQAGRGQGLKGRRNARRVIQGTLPLEIIAKGRFEKSEPTLHHGENLDEPTYIRRGVVLN
jgi:cell division protein FtsZ